MALTKSEKQAKEDAARRALLIQVRMIYHGADGGRVGDNDDFYATTIQKAMSVIKETFFGDDDEHSKFLTSIGYIDDFSTISGAFECLWRHGVRAIK